MLRDAGLLLPPLSDFPATAIVWGGSVVGTGDGMASESSPQSGFVCALLDGCAVRGRAEAGRWFAHRKVKGTQEWEKGLPSTDTVTCTRSPDLLCHAGVVKSTLPPAQFCILYVCFRPSVFVCVCACYVALEGYVLV
jgi:hypothetical protein